MYLRLRYVNFVMPVARKRYRTHHIYVSMRLIYLVRRNAAVIALFVAFASLQEQKRSVPMITNRSARIPPGESLQTQLMGEIFPFACMSNIFRDVLC